MRKYLLIFTAILLFSGAAFAQGVVTVDAVKTPAVKRATAAFPREKFDPLRDPNADLATAVGTASKSGKRIILDIGGEWCGWCVYMDKFFYQNAEIAKLRDDNYVWVKVNMSEQNENKAFLSAYPAITGYPHLYVLDTDGKFLHSQDTAALESGKGYDLPKFIDFLKTWSKRQ